VPDLVELSLETRIRMLVAEHRAELERLVDAEVDRQLGELVSERIAARNGAAVGLSEGPFREPQRTCRVCGERPATHGRTVCSRCRHRAERARKRRSDATGPVLSASEEPRGPSPKRRTAPSAPARRRGRMRGRLALRLEQELRRQIAEAPTRVEVCDGRSWLVRTLPGPSER
jgi:hypothetical protein